MDQTAAPVKKACIAMMKKGIRQQRYKLKKKYYDPYPLHLVPKKTPVKSMNDVQWLNLVDHWKSENKMVTSCHTLSFKLSCTCHMCLRSKLYCCSCFLRRTKKTEVKCSSTRQLALAAMTCILFIWLVHSSYNLINAYCFLSSSKYMCLFPIYWHRRRSTKMHHQMLLICLKTLTTATRRMPLLLLYSLLL